MEMTTKERILEAAFSFYQTCVFQNVSLAQIASKVGISKPAIFKHFKNKETLEQAMDDRVFGDFTAVLQQMEVLFTQNKGRDALALIIGYMAEHREYVFYLFSTVPRLTEDSVFMELRKRGVNLFDGIFYPDGSVKNDERYFLTVFISTTFICFMLFWFDAEDKKLVAKEKGSDFIEKFNKIIWNGVDTFVPMTGADDFSRIDTICEGGVLRLAAVDRLFAALASVIEKKGVQKITVEAIAKELGLAKSSLYSSFKNKEEMIFRLVEEERDNLYAAVLSNMEKLTSEGERVYAFLQTVMSYLIARQQVIVVFQSLVFSSSIFEKREAEEESYAENKFLKGILNQDLMQTIPDVGLPNFDKRFLISWFFAIPTMFYMHCAVHEYSGAKMKNAVRDIYRMLANGIAEQKS